MHSVLPPLHALYIIFTNTHVHFYVYLPLYSVLHLPTALRQLNHRWLLQSNSHQHLSHSPRHLLVRVSLAKRPRPMLQKTHCNRSDLIYFLPLIGISSTKKGAATSEKKTNLPPWPSRPPHLDRPIVPPTRSPMPKLISHRLPPPRPCAPTKRRSQICLVYCRVSPKTRDRRS